MSKSVFQNNKINGKVTAFNALNTLQSIIDINKIVDKKALEELKLVSTDPVLAKFAKTSTSLVYPKIDDRKVEDRIVRVVECVTGTSYNGKGCDDLWNMVGLLSQFMRCDKHGVWQVAPESSLFASGSHFTQVRFYDYKKLCGLCDIINGLEEFSIEQAPFKINDKKYSAEERVFWILKGLDKSTYSYLKHFTYDAVTCNSKTAIDVVEQETTFKCAFDTSARAAFCSSDPAKAYEYSSRSIFANSFFKANYFFGSVMKNKDKRTLEACLNIQSIVKYSEIQRGIVRVYGAQCNMTKLVRALTYAYRDTEIRFELEGNSDNFGCCGSIPYAREKCKLLINCKVYCPPQRGNILLVNAHDLYAADLKKYSTEADIVFSLVNAINQLNVNDLCIPTYVPESGEAFVSLTLKVGLDRAERAKLFTKACYLANSSGVDLVPAFFKLRAYYNVHNCEMPEVVSAKTEDVYEFVDVGVSKDYNDVFSKAATPVLIQDEVAPVSVKITENVEVIEQKIITTSTTSIEKKEIYPKLDGSGYVLIHGGMEDELAVSDSPGVAKLGGFKFELGVNGFKLESGFLSSVKTGGELTKNSVGIYFVKNGKKRKYDSESSASSHSGTFEDL